MRCFEQKRSQTEGAACRPGDDLQSAQGRNIVNIPAVSAGNRPRLWLFCFLNFLRAVCSFVREQTDYFEVFKTSEGDRNDAATAGECV